MLAACGDERSAAKDGGTGSDGGDATVVDAAPPASPLTCTPTNGTRLHGYVRQHSDGSSEDLGLYDTTYQTRCTYRRAADGKVRCLPLRGTSWDTGVVVYTTADCSGTPIIRFNYSPQTTRVVANDGGDVFAFRIGCSGVWRAFMIGDQIAQPAAVYFRDQHGVCVSTPPTAIAYYTVGGDVSPELFVEGTEAEVGDGRLFIRATIGSDGSRVCSSWRSRLDVDRYFTVHDKSFGSEPCRIQEAFDGVTRCIPFAESRSSDAYSDDSCTEQYSGIVLRSCTSTPGASIMTEYDYSGCGVKRRIRSMGATSTTPFYFKHSSGGCMLGSGFAFDEPGPYISDNQFQEMSVEAGLLGSRLLRRDHVGGGVRIAVGDYYDPVIVSNCAFEKNADGVLLCVPTGLDVINAQAVYSDNLCTTPMTVFASHRSEDCLLNPPPPRFGIMTVELESRRHWYRIGPELTGTQYYESRNPGECFPIDRPVFQVGPRLDSELVSGIELAL